MSYRKALHIGSSLGQNSLNDLGISHKTARYIYLGSLQELADDHIRNKLLFEIEGAMTNEIDVVTLSMWGNTLMPREKRSMITQINNMTRTIRKEYEVSASFTGMSDREFTPLLKHASWLVKSLLICSNAVGGRIKRIVLVMPFSRTEHAHQTRHEEFKAIEIAMSSFRERIKQKLVEDNDINSLPGFQYMQVIDISNFYLARLLAFSTKQDPYALKTKMKQVYSQMVHKFNGVLGSDYIHLNKETSKIYGILLTQVIPRYLTIPNNSHPMQEEFLRAFFGESFSEASLPDYSEFHHKKNLQGKLKRLQDTGIRVVHTPEDSVNTHINVALSIMTSGMTSKQVEQLFMIVRPGEPVMTRQGEKIWEELFRKNYPQAISVLHDLVENSENNAGPSHQNAGTSQNNTGPSQRGEQIIAGNEGSREDQYKGQGEVSKTGQRNEYVGSEQPMEIENATQKQGTSSQGKGGEQMEIDKGEENTHSKKQNVSGEKGKEKEEVEVQYSRVTRQSSNRNKDRTEHASQHEIGQDNKMDTSMPGSNEQNSEEDIIELPQDIILDKEVKVDKKANAKGIHCTLVDSNTKEVIVDRTVKVGGTGVQYVKVNKSEEQGPSCKDTGARPKRTLKNNYPPFSEKDDDILVDEVTLQGDKPPPEDAMDQE